MIQKSLDTWAVEPLSDASISTFRLESTDEFLMRILPPRNKVFWFLSVYPFLQDSLSIWDKNREEAYERKAQRELSMAGYNDLAPWLGLWGAEILECVVPGAELHNVIDYFLEQEQEFGLDSYISNQLDPPPSLMDDDVFRAVSDILHSEKTSNIWALLESDSGKRHIQSWIKNGFRFFLNDLEDINIAFAFLADYLSWPNLYPIEIEDVPDGTLRLGNIDYCNTVNKYHMSLKDRYPFLFHGTQKP